MTPTEEQQLVLDEPGCVVVTAAPGSGKTFTVCEKIHLVVEPLHPFRGIIAISFTNKASDELKHRCLKKARSTKSSFFGTIDSFMLSEIVCPFGTHIFGRPNSDFKILKDKDAAQLPHSLPHKDYRMLTKLDNPIRGAVASNYRSGYLLLESVGWLTLLIIKESKGCRNYIRAKYSHVFIDEYQDSGDEQHRLFLELVSLDLIGIAVGDLNQSIYGFSKRSPKYLIDLLSRESFRHVPITKNHRCHPSISSYANRLLDNKTDVLSQDDVRVFRAVVEGDEYLLGSWIAQAVPEIMTRFTISNPSEIGVLGRSNASLDLVSQGLNLPHKLFKGTYLDEDSSPWAICFKSLLHFSQDPTITASELIEKHLGFDANKPLARRAFQILQALKIQAADHLVQLQTDLFSQFAQLVFPGLAFPDSEASLRGVLNDPQQLDSFRPAAKSNIQLMTLHKSKGLEFDFVFHLDMHEWIIPGYKSLKGDSDEMLQDLNLHFVGITRAKQGVILCSQSLRTKDGDKKSCYTSSFLTRNRLNLYSRIWAS